MCTPIHPGHGHLNNSYFFGVDKINGWGNRSYFTYYSEFNRESAVLPYVEATTLIFLCLFSTITNSAIFVVIACNRSLRTVTNIFICNLSMSDMLFALSGPFIAACRITQTWTLGDFACNIIPYMEFVCGSVSIWTMAMISVERYICIVRDSSSMFTPRIAVIIVVAMWIAAMACFSPIPNSFHVFSFPFGNTTVKICTLQWQNWGSVRFSWLFTSFVLLTNFVIPLSILSISYFKIFSKFWKIRGLMKRTRGNVDSTWTTIRTNIRKSRDARDLRVVKIVFSLVIIFAIMWFPIYGTFIYLLVDSICSAMRTGSNVFIIGIACAMGNACVNPILYGVFNERLKSILCHCLMYTPVQRLRPNITPVINRNSEARVPYSIEPVGEEMEVD